MTYTHLITNKLVMMDAYYKEGIKITDILKALENQSRQSTLSSTI